MPGFRLPLSVQKTVACCKLMLGGGSSNVLEEPEKRKREKGGSVKFLIQYSVQISIPRLPVPRLVGLLIEWTTSFNASAPHIQPGMKQSQHLTAASYGGILSSPSLHDLANLG